MNPFKRTKQPSNDDIETIQLNSEDKKRELIKKHYKKEQIKCEREKFHDERIMRKYNRRMLPNPCWFIVKSIPGIFLYYLDLITDLYMLKRFYLKYVNSHEDRPRFAYGFCFYASLTFTIMPIICLTLYGILKKEWKQQSCCRIVFQFFKSIFNLGLIQK